MKVDTWLVVGPESGLRRIEQASGGPVVHYIDATENQVEVVTRFDHDTAIAEEQVEADGWQVIAEREREATITEVLNALEALEGLSEMSYDYPAYSMKDMLEAVKALRGKHV